MARKHKAKTFQRDKANPISTTGDHEIVEPAIEPDRSFDVAADHDESTAFYEEYPSRQDSLDLDDDVISDDILFDHTRSASAQPDDIISDDTVRREPASRDRVPNGNGESHEEDDLTGEVLFDSEEETYEDSAEGERSEEPLAAEAFSTASATDRWVPEESETDEEMEVEPEMSEPVALWAEEDEPAEAEMAEPRIVDGIVYAPPAEEPEEVQMASAAAGRVAVYPPYVPTEPRSAAPPASRPIPDTRERTTSGENWLLFVGAVGLGAVLGAVLVLLILGGINGGLSYTTTNRALQLEETQGRLTGQINAASQNISDMQAQLTTLGRLPAQVDILSSGLAASRQSLGQLTQDLNGVTEDVTGLSTTMDRVNSSVQALDGQMQTLSSDMEEVQASTQQFQTFLEGLRALLQNVPASGATR